MKRILNLFLISIIAILLFSRCSSDDHVHPSDHFEPEGWVFINESSERFIKIFQGKFEPNSKQYFEVPYQSETDHIKIKFLDSKKNEIDPPNNKETSLSWKISNPEVVNVERHFHNGNLDEWMFVMEGLKKDTTSIEFMVMHNGHVDVRSGLIKVVVK